MQIIKTVAEWKIVRDALPHKTTLGFVPTMGCLHAGHASLLLRAKNENQVVVLSIFVNPTQFNNPEDFKHYPLTPEHDILLAEEMGVDYLFMPAAEEIYPDGHTIFMDTKDPLALILEGKHRPGHFSGVLTVVLKLFNILAPTRAYFGEKDYQQLHLIHKMVKNYFMPIDIIACHTTRANSGLPLSSRNNKLTGPEREMADKAIFLFKAATPTTLLNTIQKIEALGVIVEYIEPYASYLFCALKIGSVRLIDHIKIEEKTC